jgi:hypothetical protein
MEYKVSDEILSDDIHSKLLELMEYSNKPKTKKHQIILNKTRKH